jgi:phenylacetate-CoA ligase
MLDKLNRAILLAKKTKLYTDKLKDFDVINSIEEFTKLPLTTKENLRDSYPYDGLGSNMSEVIEVHMTSGTTGKPTLSFFTKEDLELSSHYISKSWENFGIDSNSKIQFMMSYGLFSGAPLNTYAIQHLDGFVLPSGIQTTQKQVELMKDFQIDTIVATPSYYLYLYDFLVKNNIPLSAFNLKTGIAAGEAYSDEMKAKISELFNIRLFDHYGLCEVNTGIIYECNLCGEMAIIKDYVYAEIIDPVTELIVNDRQLGELVLTSTMKNASPIIRYRTGDSASIITRNSQCKNCYGSTLITRIKGRIDSVIFYKGLKLDPYELKDFIVLDSGGKIYNQIKIVVSKDQHGMAKTIVTKIAIKPGLDELNFKNFLEKTIWQKIKIPIKVEIVSSDYFEDFNTTKVKLVDYVYE